MADASSSEIFSEECVENVHLNKKHWNKEYILQNY